MVQEQYESTKTTSFLPVVETFHSIQGEGFWTGTNAFFIRLAGCDVGCKWCDQKETWSTKPYPKCNVESLVCEVRGVKPAIVVITGGEPLIYNLEELTQSLKQSGLKTHLETSGTHPVSGKWDWITLSPKRHKPSQSLIYDLASELKIVIQSQDDLIFAKSQSKLVNSDCKLFVQPEWGTPASCKLCADFVMNNPQWRISLQTHKILKVQ